MDEPHAPIRVVLAEDHPVARTGLRVLLAHQPDIEVVGEAGDGGAARRLVAEHRPDVLVLDLVMPGLEPVAFVRWVRDGSPETAVLVLTAHDRDGYLARMMEAGAVGFLSKEEAGERIVAAVRRVAGGEVLFTPWQRERARRWQQGVGRKWEHLTEREREVLRLMAEGRSNREIASITLVQAFSFA